jgi:hypothetical protein
MKTKFTLIALAAMAVTYTACQKNYSSPSSSSSGAVNNQQVSLSVAQNVVKVLDGGFGYDPSTGGTTTMSTHNSLKLNSTSGSGCAAAFDTTLNFTAKLDTITNTIKGDFKLTATCTDNPTLTMVENYTLLQVTPHISANDKLSANLTFSFGTDVNDISVIYNGNVSVNADLTYLTGTKGESKETYNYNFHAITEGSDGLDSGSADFTTTGSGIHGNWSYTGTIKFIGGNKATLTLGGKTYTVDLTTQLVTAS